MTTDNGSSSQELLEEIKVLFDQAEGAIKAIEHVEGLDIPSVNQLRYAGRHLIDFSASPEQPVEELHRARRHCQRAIYDANDAHIQYHISEIEDFVEDYKYVTVTDVYTAYPQLIAAKNSAVEFLEACRANGDVREEQYQLCMEHRETLAAMCKDLPIMRDELNKKVNDRIAATKGRWISSLLALAGIVLAALAAF